MAKKVQIKRIGVLTSGGDCAGLNTAIRAVCMAAFQQGWEVYGIHNATDGLIARPMMYKKMSVLDFSVPYARLGGTMLGSNNTGVFTRQKKADGSYEKLTEKEFFKRFKEGIEQLKLDALVVIGGDGSTAIMSRLCKTANVKMIGIPKTIDNDVPATDEAIGFSTACNIVMDALDKLDTTADSHERIMVLEVMGRTAGHLALRGAIAGLADICLIPERPYNYDEVVQKLREIRASGRTHALMVVAEGLKTPEGKNIYASNGHTFGGIGQYFVNRLSEEPDKFNVRLTVLGHVQRGGSPVAMDRLLAVAFGTYAVRLLASGAKNRLVVLKNGKLTDVPLRHALKIAISPVKPNDPMVKMAKSLGMYIGHK